MTEFEVLVGRVVVAHSPALSGFKQEPTSRDQLRAVIAKQGELVAQIRREREEGGAT